MKESAPTKDCIPAIMVTAIMGLKLDQLFVPTSGEYTLVSPSDVDIAQPSVGGSLDIGQHICASLMQINLSSSL